MKPEVKKKASEAKARGDDAFKRNDFLAAIDAYTQVHTYPLLNAFLYFLLLLLSFQFRI